MKAKKVKDYLTTSDVAKIFNVSHMTIHRWTEKYNIPHSKVGNRLTFNNDSINFIKNNVIM